jgi:hypothetical protein
MREYSCGISDRRLFSTANDSMNERKRLIRELVLGLLLRENANDTPSQYPELKSLLAEILARRAGIVNATYTLPVFPREYRLEETDAAILLEVFLGLGCRKNHHARS